MKNCGGRERRIRLSLVVSNDNLELAACVHTDTRGDSQMFFRFVRPGQRQTLAPSMVRTRSVAHVRCVRA